MALITTPGAVDADSYVDVADATAILARQLLTLTQWEAADQLTLEAALRRATARLDLHVIWQGTLGSTTQALGWPRSGVTDREGREIDDATIPAWLEQATAEYANALLIQAGDSNRLEGIRSLSVDGLSMTFDQSVNSSADERIPVHVQQLIAPYATTQDSARLTTVRS